MVVGVKESVLAGINPSKLPLPSDLALTIYAECKKESPDVNLLASLIDRDASILARLYHLSNSVSIRRNSSISSLSTREVILTLGTNTVGKYVMVLSMMFKTPSDNAFPCTAFHRHSFIMGSAAKQIARQYKLSRDDGFLLGMLANIGRLGLAFGFENSYTDLLTGLPVGVWPTLTAEESKLTVNSMDVSIWIINAVGFSWMIPYVTDYWNGSPGILHDARLIADIVIGVTKLEDFPGIIDTFNTVHEELGSDIFDLSAA